MSRFCYSNETGRCVGEVEARGNGTDRTVDRSLCWQSVYRDLAVQPDIRSGWMANDGEQPDKERTRSAS